TAPAGPAVLRSKILILIQGTPAAVSRGLVGGLALEGLLVGRLLVGRGFVPGLPRHLGVGVLGSADRELGLGELDVRSRVLERIRGLVGAVAPGRGHARSRGRSGAALPSCA